MTIPKARPIDVQPRSDEKPTLHPEGRRCAECDKGLTRFNPGPSCYACQDAREAEFPPDLVALMSER